MDSLSREFLCTGIPEEDEALRHPVRIFLSKRLKDITPARRARSWMSYDLDFSQSLARAGFLGLTLPKRYGGSERSQFARFVVNEELLAAGAPVGAHWFAERQCAPLILRYGTEEQRERHLSAICRGETSFCIGLSEPETGSDLSSVRTTATRTDDGWLINGQKIWTSFGHQAHMMSALVRTSGKHGDRHVGLSQLLIDMRTPGITVKPIRDLAGDMHFAEIFFTDVLVPPDALLGQEGQGWSQVTAELAYERSGPERYLSTNVLIDQWLTFERAGERASGQAGRSDRELLGRTIATSTAMRLLSLAMSAADPADPRAGAAAASIKDFGTSYEQRVPSLIAERLAAAERPIPGPLAETLDYLQAMSPAFSLRGGTREVMRGIVARGLGLR